MIPHTIDLENGQYVVAVTLVDPSGAVISATNPLKISSEIITPVHIVSTASDNARSIKASSAKLFSVYAVNSDATDRFVKIYNKASAPIVGMDIPVKTIKVPASDSVHLESNLGCDLSEGLAIAITTGMSDTDIGVMLTAGQVVLDIDYA